MTRRRSPPPMPNQPPDAPGPRFTSQLTGLDYALPGTLARRFMRCGKTNCRCKSDPPPLHGPYLHWTRTVAGKTVTRSPAPAPAPRPGPAATKPGSTTPAGSATSWASSRPGPYAPSKTPRGDPVNAEISPSRSAERQTHGKFSNVWPRQDPPKINGDLQDVARGVHEGFDELLDPTAVDEGLGRVSALFAESQDSLVRSPAGSALCQRRTA